MSIYGPSRSPWTSRMLSIMRIVIGAMFITFGTMKLLGFPAPPGGQPMPPIPVLSQTWIAGVLELVGGLLITLGFLTRPTAFILAGEMAVAYFQFHQPKALFPVTNEGIPAVLYCFIFLYLIFAGGGEWSVDTLIARSRGERIDR